MRATLETHMLRRAVARAAAGCGGMRGLATTVYEPSIGAAQLKLPNVPLTEYLLERSQQFGAKAAFTDGLTGVSVSHADFPRYVVALAQRLLHYGLREKEVAAVVLPNSPTYPIVFHGILAAGGTATTVNVQYTAEEMAAQFADCGAKMVFVHPAFKATVEAACKLPGCKVQHVFLVGDKDSVVPDLAAGPPADAPKAATALAELRALFAHQVPRFNPATHVAALPYSSGTTGRPKGVRVLPRAISRAWRGGGGAGGGGGTSPGVGVGGGVLRRGRGCWRVAGWAFGGNG
jgi:acyl-CoA synthetase (AMP-forming)/AMP-acid ligase II